MSFQLPRIWRFQCRIYNDPSDFNNVTFAYVDEDHLESAIQVGVKSDHIVHQFGEDNKDDSFIDEKTGTTHYGKSHPLGTVSPQRVFAIKKRKERQEAEKLAHNADIARLTSG
jgi:hypothetical protein